MFSRCDMAGVIAAKNAKKRKEVSGLVDLRSGRTDFSRLDLLAIMTDPGDAR